MEADLSLDALIRSELEGKDKAIGAYDEMLWKIRTGYAAVLYGLFTLVVSMTNIQNMHIPLEKAGLVAFTLITGFTICAVVLDFAFLRSKAKVVQTKEELADLALLLASGGTLEQWHGSSLPQLLHNSGEDQLRVSWKLRPSVLPIAMLYLCTWGPLTLAILLIVLN